MKGLLPLSFIVLLLLLNAQADEVPTDIQAWFQPQKWQRDTDGPILSLGEKGQFDDTHIFAPVVIREKDGPYKMYYCGSQGDVSKRVFQLGMATSEDGRVFQRFSKVPVFGFGNGKHSVLTPSFLRNPDGSVLRENGKLRMWFVSTDFQDTSGLHTFHETTSENGVDWDEPSDVQLKNVYSPTILKDAKWYRMWYVDVGKSPWIVRHARSLNGIKWELSLEPCVFIDQSWERQRLFYPTVRKIDGVYLMWYGSYWNARSSTTATGLALSLDGYRWYKHPDNPVLRPDPMRSWESNYVTSQSVLRQEDGSFRIWYASRKKPPFKNKYFALNTAIWNPSASEPKSSGSPAVVKNGAAAFRKWQTEKRQHLRKMLGIPENRVPLDAEKRGEVYSNGVIIEKWVFTSEPGSRVPAILYRPAKPENLMPAIVFTFGHGGSKSQWQYHYGGLVYAKLGLACLALDPIGEEERHSHGRLGTRAHDPKGVSDRADKAGRLVMGKLVFDTMRGIDFLLKRKDIDPERIGVAGNSLGGAKASWMAAIEPRIRMAIVSGWAYDDIGLRTKYCTRLPNERMRELLSWVDYAALAAPDCAVLITNGDADWVIDKGDSKVWNRTREVVAQANSLYETLGNLRGIQTWFEKDGGHRPYFTYKVSLEWIHRHLGTPAMTLEQIQQLPTVNGGQWCDQQGIQLERLYGTELHQRGSTLPDFGLKLTPREQLRCLKPGELGSAEFTVQGWLKKIEEK